MERKRLTIGYWMAGLTGLASFVTLAADVVTGVATGVLPDRPFAVWEGVRIYRDLAYGSRGDAPGEGRGYRSALTRTLEDGRIVHSHRSGQFYDLFVDDAAGVRPDMPVYVNVHGGAWCQPPDKDGENFWWLRRMAKAGFLVVNMDYQLQNDALDPEREPKCREHATFLDMLRDIDAMNTYLSDTLLPSLRVGARRFGLGGCSAGAHLSLLYAFDAANPSVLSAGLAHALPVDFVVDSVGPTDLSGAGFLGPFVAGDSPWGSMIPKSASERGTQLLSWLTDEDLVSAFRGGREEHALSVLRRYSPLHLATSNAPPVVMAYCQRWPLAKTDGYVSTDDFYRLRDRLEELGVPVAADIRTFRMHGWLGDDFEKWVCERAVEFANRTVEDIVR